MSSLININGAPKANSQQHSLYTLALPLETTINKVSELSELQNQLQFIQSLQALQTQSDEGLLALESGETIDNSEIGQDDGTWNLPLIYEEQPILNGLDNFESQNMLNGVQDITHMTIQNDSNTEAPAVHVSNESTGYTINVDGLQYGLHLHRDNNIAVDSNNVDGSDDEYISYIDNIPAQEDLDHLIEYDPTCDLTEIAHILTAYKCRKCDFTIYDKDIFLEHFTDNHLFSELNYNADNKLPVEQNSRHLAQGRGISETRKIIPKESLPSPSFISSDADMTTEIEPYMYLCGECSEGYGSIEDCRDHMIKVHKLTRKTNAKESVTSKETDLKSKKSVSFNESHDIQDILSARHIPAAVEISGEKDKKEVCEESHWLLPKSIKELKNALVSQWKARCGVTTCLYRFKDVDSLAKHTACHLPVQPRRKSHTMKLFKCSECPQEFMNWRTCSVHLWKDHEIDVDMLTCPICLEYRTPTTVKLSHHLKIHSSTRGFLCNQCGKAFKQPTQLRNHKVTHLKDNKDQTVMRWYTQKTCEICSKTFSDSKCLKKHIQSVHSKIRPFICNVCGHSCTRKAMLQMHLRQHTGEKPYSCTECEYRTSDHNTLRRHIMRHKGVRPYQCPYCPYAAIQSCAYKTHLRNKHQGKPGLFSCTECPFKSVNAKVLESHIHYHKKGLIDSYESTRDRTGWRTYTGRDDGVEVFPGNIAAARLVYSCLGEGPPTASITQTNAHAQTITIQIPARESEDEETQNCFLAMHRTDTLEEAVDTGGVTIPADDDPSLQVKNICD